MRFMMLLALPAMMAAAPASAASLLEQLSPLPAAYVYGTDFGIPAERSDGTYAFGPAAVDVTATIFRLTAQGGGLSLGCSSSDFGGGAAGRIVLLARGDCAFQDKVVNASAAGAVGVLIADNGVLNPSLDFSGNSGAPLAITGFRLSRDLGALLAEQTLGQTTSIHMALGQNLVSQLPSAVPEPATWALMIIGFGMSGYSMRRRKLNTRTSFG